MSPDLTLTVRVCDNFILSPSDFSISITVVKKPTSDVPANIETISYSDYSGQMNDDCTRDIFELVTAKTTNIDGEVTSYTSNSNSDHVIDGSTGDVTFTLV